MQKARQQILAATQKKLDGYIIGWFLWISPRAKIKVLFYETLVDLRFLFGVHWA